MKNLVAIVFLLCLVCTIAPAQSPPHMQAGVTVQYGHYNLTDSNTGISATDDRSNIAIGAFFDAIYLRANIEYQSAISGTLAITGLGSADYPSGFSVSFINLKALGKYPFQLGTTTLWPAIGVRYSYPLSVKIGGVDLLADPNSDFADFYVCFGGGLDFATGPVVIGFSALYDYSLTPSQTKSTLFPGEKVSGFDLEIALNVGFAL